MSALTELWCREGEEDKRPAHLELHAQGTVEQHQVAHEAQQVGGQRRSAAHPLVKLLQQACQRTQTHKQRQGASIYHQHNQAMKISSNICKGSPARTHTHAHTDKHTRNNTTQV